MVKNENFDERDEGKKATTNGQEEIFQMFGYMINCNYV